MKVDLPQEWIELLAEQLDSPEFTELSRFVEGERNAHPVFPAEEDVFRAFQLTIPQEVRVVILGQDPYHNVGQAHGLAFSVRRGCPLPPSLKNIFKELRDDLQVQPPEHGDLSSWARQGVFLLNTVLTVRVHEAHSHRKQGWELFTDSVIRKLSESRLAKAFVLWGKPAQEKRNLIDESIHKVFVSPHPSPLSARRGFFGSKPFSNVNAFLKDCGVAPIEWQIPSDEATA